MNQRIIGVDPGANCGMVVLDDGQITAVLNIISENFFSKITNFLFVGNPIIVLEDIRPYSLRLTPQVIDTCKFIGEALYRLRIEAGANVRLVTRYDIKKWVFDRFPEVSGPMVRSKILKKAFPACDLRSREEILVYGDGEAWKERKGSFVYVDDNIVKAAMRQYYDISIPKAGSGYQYGLKDDAWQALAVATFTKESLQTCPSFR